MRTALTTSDREFATAIAAFIDTASTDTLYWRRCNVARESLHPATYTLVVNILHERSIARIEARMAAEYPAVYAACWPELHSTGKHVRMNP
jgi:hypothetical protein